MLPSHTCAVRPNILWSLPSLNFIKINVDWSFSSSASGIGGVFRDHQGAFLLYFVKSVDMDYANYAEVLAIREGLLVVAASRWASSKLSWSSLIRAMLSLGSSPRLMPRGDSNPSSERLFPDLVVILNVLLLILDVLVTRLPIFWLEWRLRATILLTLSSHLLFWKDVLKLLSCWIL